MEHKLINQRNRESYEKISDVEVSLTSEEIKSLSNGMAVHFSINMKIGQVIVAKKID